MTLAARLLLTLAVFSIGTNVLLTWQWQSERQAFKDSLADRETQVQVSAIRNRKLSKDNVGFQAEISQKEAELGKKQNELNDLSKQLEQKKKDLEQKIADLTNAEKRITDQKSQLDANASELSKLRNRPPLFSFQVSSSSLADVEAKKTAVRQVVTAAYDTIEDVYGKPYLLHSVTITFVDSLSNSKAYGEIVITNSDQGIDLNIKIRDFDKNNFNDVNTIIHEVMHSFHGLAVLEPTAFEEGIVVAATDVVMKKMIAAGSIPSFSPLYIRLTESEFNNFQSTLSIPRSVSAFYASDQVADFYQVTGKAWYKLYETDSNFFKNFNEKLYAKKAQGQEITESLVLQTIKEVQPNADLRGAAWQLK